MTTKFETEHENITFSFTTTEQHLNNIKTKIAMTTLETILYILGWSTMIGIFNYLESE